MADRHLHIDHVGSLLRPMALREARQRILGVHDADHNLGAHDNAELRAIEDGHVRDVVKLQESVGLPVVTDGEFRRRSWWTDFVLGFSGTRVSYTGKSPLTFVNAAGDKRPAPGVRVEGKVRHRGSINAEPFKFLKSATRRIAKVTIPGPPIVHYLRDENFVPGVYPDLDKFWADVVAAYRAEIDALAAAGCTHLQIDECMLPWLCDPRHQAWVKSRGDDPAQLIDMYVKVTAAALAGAPKGMTLALHMCRGNLNAFWGGEGGYEPIAEKIFNALPFTLYLMEYDTPRAGDFAPLRHLPKGKTALLGIVSTKEKALERADDVRRRIDEAARHAPIERLGLCPQCGFSTNMFGTEFTEEDERRKLSLIVDVAGRTWH